MDKEYNSHMGGHITLFFTVEKEGRLLRNQGSRGVGINIQHGVEAKLSIKQEGEKIRDSTISVYDLRGKLMPNSDIFYRDLIDDLVYAKLLDDSTSFDITVSLELPTSQGFGMSAAGLIAVALAFREYTKRGNLDQYYRICHRIERQHGSGLGDVLGIYAGGVEIRLQPGAPGASGSSLGFKCKQPIILVWQRDETRHTSKYINDANWQAKITKAGHMALNNVKNGPWNHSRWKDILDQSSNFCHDSELMFETERKHLLDNVRKVVRSIDMQSHVSIRLCMLGTSCVILPRKLNRMISQEELDLLHAKLIEKGLESLISAIDS